MSKSERILTKRKIAGIESQIEDEYTKWALSNLLEICIKLEGRIIKLESEKNSE
jgi:hypothetical protein